MNSENQSVARAWGGNGVLWDGASRALPDQRRTVQSQLATDGHLRNTVREASATQSRFRSRSSLRLTQKAHVVALSDFDTLAY